MPRVARHCDERGSDHMKVRVVLNGRGEDVVVEPVPGQPTRFRVTRAEQTEIVDCAPAGDGRYSLLRLDGDHASADVAVVQTDTPGEMTVRVDGAVFLATVGGRQARSRSPAIAGGSDGTLGVVAPMPGKVVQLLVGPGDEVEAGQGLVVVEAMKMENEIRAPHAGRVETVQVEVGMVVEVDRVLVVVAPVEPPGRESV